MDSFYPVISLAAFLSGGCFGFYYAWRSRQLALVERDAAQEHEPLADAA